ncbi:MAG: VOC family protein [Eubacteriales bacterium]|nr:VOC family protein [Eubacteriales bacterium]
MRISVMYSTMIVDDLTESVMFYRDVLGFHEGYHVELPVGAITIMESPGGAAVELIEAKQFPTGLYSVGCDVDDLDEVIGYLKEKGCGILGEIASTTVGRQVFIQDPGGNRLCLIEHSEDYRNKYMS